MNSLLILDKNADTYAEELKRHTLQSLKIYAASSVEAADIFIRQANIILGRPDLVAMALPKASNLVWVQSTFAGVDALCRQELPRDYRLTGVKEVFGPLMSEFVFAYLLALERHLFEIHSRQSAKRWQDVHYRSLTELTIGVAGLGSIGQHVAKTASHFGMKVLGLKRSPGHVNSVNQVYTPGELNTFLPQLDYLVMILPDTPESKHLIAKPQFKLMKDSAVIINVGRGATIHQQDLIEALLQQQIGGAVLDVFEEEPLPETSPLWTIPTVHISPHIAATSFPLQIANIFRANYQRFLENKELNYLIDFDRGY